MKVVDFVLDEGDLNILKEDGTAVRVVPKLKQSPQAYPSRPLRSEEAPTITQEQGFLGRNV
ncbi:hypothetical protein ANCCAN_14314 [Ancylostoma caninum]|uniref:Uncharacterized protein n=1 Tax=Ancylostoma caninum TaxID=29170 RepID=A0A368G5W4_ANCCA|nr:hypothetical protein ANCCAN_14314 [Ancylostoma caninum]